MDLGAVLTLASGLAEALASIHRAGLIHRDLKPNNVILNDTGPHIIDFGIAVPTDADRMTSTLLMGTPSYMAPERLQGGEGSQPGDIFALGATLFYAVTGRDLVNGATTYIKILQVTEGRFDMSVVPKELRLVIVRCVSRRPKDRPTADELARIFAASGIARPTPGWYEPTAPPAPVVALESLPTSPVTRRRLLAGAGALGLLGLAGGLAATRVIGIGARAAAPKPGRVLWQVRSGARSAPGPSTSPGALSPTETLGQQIVVDPNGRIIVARGTTLVVLDFTGTQMWSRPLSESVRLYPWGEVVLAASTSWIWSVRPQDGAMRLVLSAADLDASTRSGAQPAEIGRIAVSPARAFVRLDAMTVAIDRAGRLAWSRPLSEPPAGGPYPISPLVADSQWLVTHDVFGATTHVGVFDAAVGLRKSAAQHEVAPRPDPTGPGPGPGPGPGRGPSGSDPAWLESEGRIDGAYVFVRDGYELRAVRLSDGDVGWQKSSEKPVVGIEPFRDLVLLAADQLYAFGAATGELRWVDPLRGSRLAVTPNGATLVAVSDDGIAALDASGTRRWEAPLPESLATAMPVWVSARDDVAFVIFRPRGDGPPLGFDVAAFAL
jgi:outer membrane protein assembly factor BamB